MENEYYIEVCEAADALVRALKLFSKNTTWGEDTTSVQCVLRQAQFLRLAAMGLYDVRIRREGASYSADDAGLNFEYGTWSEFAFGSDEDEPDL